MTYTHPECDRCGWPILRDRHGRTCAGCGMTVCLDAGTGGLLCPCDCLVQISAGVVKDAEEETDG